jgi:hypothetical protein
MHPVILFTDWLPSELGLSKNERTFTGSMTTLRTHIKRWAAWLLFRPELTVSASRKANTHFEEYRKRCTSSKIPMNARAIPDIEKTASAMWVLHSLIALPHWFSCSQQTLDSALVTKPPLFTRAGLLEYIVELVVVEDEAFQLVDKGAFRRLLEYLRPSLIARDIPHKTKVRDEIMARAEGSILIIKAKLLVRVVLGLTFSVGLSFP